MAQTLDAIFYQGDQDRIDYFPSGAAVANGQVVKLPSTLATTQVGVGFGVCTSPEGIADGGTGSLAITGQFKLLKVVADAIAFALGAQIFWNVAARKVATAGGAGILSIGTCTRAAVAGDDNVVCQLNDYRVV